MEGKVKMEVFSALISFGQVGWAFRNSPHSAKFFLKEEKHRPGLDEFKSFHRTTHIWKHQIFYS
jgi:hypothetical protein